MTAEDNNPEEVPAVVPEGESDNNEGLSKNALKKKLKAERAAKLKAEKDAAKVRKIIQFIYMKRLILVRICGARKIQPNVFVDPI